MISLKTLSAAAFALSLAACASTQDTASQDMRVAANTQGGGPDEMVCENERVTGQLIPRRVCMTRSEREALRRDAVESFDEETTRNLRVGDPGGGQ